MVRIHVPVSHPQKVLTPEEMAEMEELKEKEVILSALAEVISKSSPKKESLENILNKTRQILYTKRGF